MTTVKFPFTIQSGSVATTDDPLEGVGSMIVFCVGTMIGERVMRPSWGVDILNTVLSVGGDLDAALQEGVENAFKVWFPEYEPRGFKITRDSYRPTYVEIEFRYGRYDSDVDEIARVGTQLPGGTEINANEGF